MSISKEKNKVLRVTQLDVGQLDQQAFNILQSELKDSFENGSLSFLLYIEPELNAVLRFILWRLSIAKSGVTIGQSMFNTEYLSSNGKMTYKQRYIFGIVTVLIPWITERYHNIIKAVEGILQMKNKSQHLHYFETLFYYMETSMKGLSLINFLLFLKYGKHVSLLQRLLRLDHVFTGKPTPRFIDYEYMRKDMIQESVIQTMLCLLPLINIRKLTNMFFNVCRYFNGETSLDVRTHFVCQICFEKATNPYNGECDHVFCYFCIKSNLIADSAYTCPTCAQLINEIAPCSQNV